MSGPALEGRSFLGNSRGPADGKTFRAVDAASGQALEPAFFGVSREDVGRAVDLAVAAAPVLAGWSGARRASLLRKMAECLQQDAEAIVARASQETALPLARLQGEMGRTCGQLRLFAELVEDGAWCDARIDHAAPDRKPVPKPDVRSVLRPVGPVAVFGASNFPLAFSVAGGDTASALAAGCPVIFKAHPGHPGASELVAKSLLRACREDGAPEGIFSLLFCPGHETGAALVQHPGIRAVGFTGSLRGGRALMDLAAGRPDPIPVFAEMSSVNPIFVLPGALAERAEALAKGYHASVVLGCGQFCTNPGILFLSRGEGSDTFLAALAAAVRETPASPMLTPETLDAYRAGVKRLSSAPGIEALARGADGEGKACAAAFRTTWDNFARRPELAEEVFGPSALVVECGSSQDLMLAATGLRGQLTATVHAGANEAWGELLSVLETKAGRVLCNGYPTGVEVCPSMVHGGPYPAGSDARATSVGTRAIYRFARPVCYQDLPDAALPAELQEANPLGIVRLVDGKLECAK